MRNAVFVNVTKVKSTVQSAHANGQKGVAGISLGITELKTEVQAAQTESRTGVAELKVDIGAAHARHKSSNRDKRQNLTGNLRGTRRNSDVAVTLKLPEQAARHF